MRDAKAGQPRRWLPLWPGQAFPRALPAQTSSYKDMPSLYFVSPSSRSLKCRVCASLLLSSRLRSSNGPGLAAVTGSQAPVQPNTSLQASCRHPSTFFTFSPLLSQHCPHYPCVAGTLPPPCARSFPSRPFTNTSPVLPWRPTTYRCTATFAPRSQISVMSHTCSPTSPAKATCPTTTRSKFARPTKKLLAA